LLGTFTASGTGALSGTVAIANTVAPGSYTLTLTGFTASNTARWVSVGMSVKAGYLTKVITVTFATTTTVVSAAAAKLLAGIPALVKGSSSVKIDIKGWAAGAKASAALTKLGVTRATAIKTALTKLKVAATYTAGYGGLEKATSKTSRGVITITYAAP
jgi:outer membrane protein OmpA-like peptidoglycan-associated protein